MASRMKVTKQEKVEESNLTKFTKSVVTNMTRGKFVCPATKVSEKKTEKKTTSSSSITAGHKEMSGIKLALKKDPVLEVFQEEEKTRATTDAVLKGLSKTKYAECFDYAQFSEDFMRGLFKPLDQLENAEDAAMMASHVVYVPSLGLSGSLIDISKYFQAYVISDNAAKKNIARSLMIVLYNDIIDQRGNVLSCANLVGNADKKDFELNASVSVDKELWNISNLNGEGELTRTGVQNAAALHAKYARFIKCYKPVTEEANWWETPIAHGMHAALFPEDLEQLAVSRFPKKTDNAFAAEHEAAKLITHDNFLSLCRRTAAIKTIALSKVPKEYTEEDDSTSKVIYTFCDLSREDHVNDVLLQFPLKIDGVASTSDVKTSSKKAPSAAKSPLQTVLDRYFVAARLIAGAKDGEDFFTEMINHKRCFDVTANFLAGGKSGFNHSKMTDGTTFTPYFKTDGLPEINEANIQEIYELYSSELEADGAYDRFVSLIMGMLLRTVKITATRRNAKTGEAGKSAEERTREFFRLLFPEDESLADNAVSRLRKTTNEAITL